VQIKAFFARAGFAIGFEQLRQLIEVVGVGAEVAHPLSDLVAHLNAVVAVKTVPFHNGRTDAVPVENMLESAFNGGGSGARRSVYGNDWMLL